MESYFLLENDVIIENMPITTYYNVMKMTLSLMWRLMSGSHHCN